MSTARSSTLPRLDRESSRSTIFVVFLFFLFRNNLITAWIWAWNHSLTKWMVYHDGWLAAMFIILKMRKLIAGDNLSWLQVFTDDPRNVIFDVPQLIESLENCFVENWVKTAWNNFTQAGDTSFILLEHTDNNKLTACHSSLDTPEAILTYPDIRMYIYIWLHIYLVLSHLPLPVSYHQFRLPSLKLTATKIAPEKWMIWVGWFFFPFGLVDFSGAGC